jgi:ankyrin repeat protein
MNFLERRSKLEASSQALMAVKKYSQHSNYSQEIPRQMTGLYLGAYFGAQGVVKALLDKDCLNFQDSHRRTPLSWAAANRHEAVVKLLLEQGAELESKDTEYGQTPLSWAAENGHESVVELLLKNGVEVEMENRSGWTALQQAALNRHEGVEQLLVIHGSSEPEDFYELQQLFLLG